MKLIILRGLPGCGKSTIAEKLYESLDSKVVYSDSFKREFIESNSSFENKDVYRYAHDKVLGEIEKYFNQKEKLVIVEELFEDKNFVEKIKIFCKENNIEISWFYIKRDLEKLLEIESSRKRKTKNTIEDFKKLQNSLDEIKNEGEIVVDNNGSIENSVNFILKSLEE